MSQYDINIFHVLTLVTWPAYCGATNGNTTHTHTAVLRPFVLDYPGGPVPEDTFTHSHLKRVVGVCRHSGFYEA